MIWQCNALHSYHLSVYLPLAHAEGVPVHHVSTWKTGRVKNVDTGSTHLADNLYGDQIFSHFYGCDVKRAPDSVPVSITLFCLQPVSFLPACFCTSCVLPCHGPLFAESTWLAISDSGAEMRKARPKTAASST